MRRPFPSLRSFTLIELLVVMGVIAILAAITLGAAGYVQKKAAASRAQGEIAAMEAALERYKIDNGIYPIPDANSIIEPMTIGTNLAYNTNATTYTNAAKTLYMALSGKSNYAMVATGPTYMEFKANQISSTNTGSPPYVQDPFGYSYGYVADDPATLSPTDGGGGKTNVQFNVGFFDLWSTGGQNGTAGATNVNRWITNWKSE